VIQRIHRPKFFEYESESDDEPIPFDEDVRVETPRFTPLARMESPFWRKDALWHHPSELVPLWVCTGCDISTGLRWVWRVVLIMHGETYRYMHKLCAKCIKCILTREASIQYATLGREVTLLQMEPAWIQAPILPITLELEPLPPDPFVWFDEWDESETQDTSGDPGESETRHLLLRSLK